MIVLSWILIFAGILGTIFSIVKSRRKNSSKHEHEWTYDFIRNKYLPVSTFETRFCKCYAQEVKYPHYGWISYQRFEMLWEEEYS